MNAKLCMRLGLIPGGFVGALLSLVHSSSLTCCGGPVLPATWSKLAMDGLIVALLTAVIVAALICLLTHLPAKPVFLLAFYIGILDGILLGPLGYHIHPAGLSLIVCAFLGAFLGWLVCRLICGFSANAQEVTP